MKKFLSVGFRLALALLLAKSLEDGADHGTKTFLELGAAGGIPQFNPAPFAANQTRLAQHPKMLGQSGLRQLIRIVVGTIASGAILFLQIQIDLNTHRIRKSIENAFDCDLVQCRMKERFHISLKYD